MVFLFGSFSVFADTIKLKDGSIIRGRVIGFREGKFYVQIGEGSRERQMVFYFDEIDSIEFDGVSQIGAIRAGLREDGAGVLPKPTSTSAPIVVTTSTLNLPSAENSPTPTPTPVPSPVPTPIPTPTPVVVKTPVAPTPIPTPLPTPRATPVPSPTPNVSTRKGIQIDVAVLADNTANGWTSSGLILKKGQRIRVTGKGQVNLGNGVFSPPDGIKSLADKDKLIKEEATGGLIAVVGDDNNDFIFIGASREFIAARDGALFLGVNEGFLDDNSGSFSVVIEIDP